MRLSEHSEVRPDRHQSGQGLQGYGNHVSLMNIPQLSGECSSLVDLSCVKERYSFSLIIKRSQDGAEDGAQLVEH